MEKTWIEYRWQESDAIFLSCAKETLLNEEELDDLIYTIQIVARRLEKIK